MTRFLKRNSLLYFIENMPFAKVNVVFRTTHRLSNILRFKDVVSPDLASHLIYLFKCSCCNAGYIGETRKHFKVRYSQHLRISEYTGRPIKSGVPTTVSKHIFDNNCKCSKENFKIIGREEDYHKRLIKESLFIKLFDFELNKQQKSTDLHLF